MKYRSTIVLITTFLCLLLTGCWDSIEIQHRAFVTGVGIDAISEGPSPEDTFLVSIEVPKFSSAAQSGGGGHIPSSYILQSTAPTIFGALRNIAARSDLSLFFGHMRLLIVGEDAARRGLGDILDVWERGTEASRRFRVVVAEGDARDVLSVSTSTTEVTSSFIYSVMDNADKTSRFITGSTYGGILMALHETGNVLLPRVVPGKQDVAVAGSGIIKDWKLVGWLDETETRAVGLVLGYITGGAIDVINYPESGKRVSLEILNATKQVKAQVAGNEVTANVKVTLDLRVSEASVQEKVTGEEYLRSLEQAAALQIKQDIQRVIQKLQKEFQADVLGIGWLVQRERPKDWQRLESSWSEVFSQAKMDVEVTVRIREIGMVG